MGIERRTVLGGLAALGLAGAVGGKDPAAAALAPGERPEARPVLVLASAAAEPSGFLEGIAAAGGHVREVMRPDFSLNYLERATAALRAQPGLRLLGLMDDASAAILIGLARSTGARQQWLANHWVGGGRSRHVVLSADPIAGCAGRLGRHLDSCGADFDLIERSPPGDAPHLRMGGRPGDRVAAPENWPAVLGYLLVGQGAKLVDDSRLAALPAASGPALAGHFVSISLGN